MLELLTSTFFINALLASALISIASGVLAPLMMINRLFSTAGALTHSAFGGVGIAFYFTLPVFWCISLYSVLTGLFMAHLSWQKEGSVERLSGVIWSFGMALGLILIDLSPGYHPSIESFLFGNILAISHFDLYAMAVISFAFVVIALLFHAQLELLSFDKELALLRGLKPLYFLLMIMLCLCISVSMKLLGLILMMALLSVPVLIAKSYAKSLLGLMCMSGGLTFAFCVLGLIFSFYFDTLSAASIVMVAIICLIIFKLRRKYEYLG